MLMHFVAAVTPVGPDSTADSAFSLDPFTVSLLFGTLIPIVGGVLLKNSLSGTFKAIVNLVLSALAAVINVSLTEGGGAIVSESTLKSTGLTFLVSIATLYGVWKPTGVDAELKANVGFTDKGDG